MQQHPEPAASSKDRQRMSQIGACQQRTELLKVKPAGRIWSGGKCSVNGVELRSRL